MVTQIKTTTKEFARWLVKILRKWIWAIGFFPLVLDYLNTYVPKNNMPSGLRDFLEKGGNWQITLTLFVLGFVLSVFLVYHDVVLELHESHRRLLKIEEKQPNIVVGFQDQAYHLSETIQFQLLPLPPKPDFDALLSKEADELLPKLPPQSTNHSNGLDIIVKITNDLSRYDRMSEPNPSYQEELQAYLKEYRAYLTRSYEYDIASYRTFAIYPVAENRADFVARDVRIEFLMPKSYKRVQEHQKISLSKEQENQESERDQELREIKKNMICKMPERPKARISFFSSPKLYDSLSLITPPQSSRYPESNVSGPEHEDRSGSHYVIYQAKSLVQHRLEDDFSPFLIWLDDVDEPTVWEIPVEITSSDLQKPQRQILRIEISFAEGVA